MVIKKNTKILLKKPNINWITLNQMKLNKNEKKNHNELDKQMSSA